MARLETRDGRFVLISSYEERHVPKQAGFRWDPAKKQWWTDDATRAARLIDVADDATRATLSGAARAREDALNASRAVEADIEIPVPAGLAPFPFQRAGVAFAAQREAVLIADEMGLGKTIQAILLANIDASVNRVLVVTTLSMAWTWRAEWQKWSTRGMRVEVATAKCWPTEADVVITHWDILARHQERAVAFAPDMVVSDECHKAKNPKAQRAKALYAIPARRRVLLTGTPLVNRPIELQPLLDYLQPGQWPFWPFVKRYCAAHKVWVPGRGGGKEVWDLKGASHLDELQERMRQNVMVRRLKRDVLKELPAKTRQIVRLVPDGMESAVAEEARIYTRHEDALERAVLAVEEASAFGGEYEGAASALRATQREMAAELAKARHRIAVLKAPKVVRHILDAIEEDADRKVVLFAHHKEAIKLMQEELIAEGVGVVTITGDGATHNGAAINADGPRAEAQRLFQEDPTVRVFIGSITACAEGLTLTASHHVVFAELDWRPGIVCQAEDRCHRIGQRENVLVQHLVVDGSVDAKLVSTIIAKQRVIDAALDTSTEIKVEADVEQAERKAEATVMLPAEQKAAIHEALRFLAGRCDGAVDEDGMGFNGRDARFGHRLAECGTLTDRQALAGQRMLRTYRKTQVPVHLTAAIWPGEEAA